MRRLIWCRPDAADRRRLGGQHREDQPAVLALRSMSLHTVNGSYMPNVARHTAQLWSNITQRDQVRLTIAMPEVMQGVEFAIS
jgi:hypothetical protein